MHEITLASEIISIAQSKAKEFGRKKILKITICVGALACVEVRTLKSCFEVVAENTMAEAAEIVTEKILLDAVCTGCSHSFQIQKRQFKCPACNDRDIRFEGGRELYVKSIETD